MPNGSHIEITGNLTRDPEMRFTPNGVAVAKLTVAVTPRKRDANGDWNDGDPQYWDVTAWRSLAENVSESLMRGDCVTVIGSVDFRQWESKEGDKRHQHEIIADKVSVDLAFQTVRVKRANRGKPGNGKSASTNADAGTDANAESVPF